MHVDHVHHVTWLWCTWVALIPLLSQRHAPWLTNVCVSTNLTLFHDIYICISQHSISYLIRLVFCSLSKVIYIYSQFLMFLVCYWYSKNMCWSTMYIMTNPSALIESTSNITFVRTWCTPPVKKNCCQFEFRKRPRGWKKVWFESRQNCS